MGKTVDHVDLLSDTKSDPIIVDDEVDGLVNNYPLTQDKDVDPTSTIPTGAPPESKGDDEQDNDGEPGNETSGSDKDNEVEEEGNEYHNGIHGNNQFTNEAEDDMANDKENPNNENRNNKREVTEIHDDNNYDEGG